MVAAYNLEAADDLSVPPKHPDSDLVEVNKIGRNTHFHNVKRTDYKFPANNLGTLLEKVHKKLSNVREHRRRKF